MFAPDDYPASLRDAFAVTWDFPSAEVPKYLQRLAPEVYAAEQERVAIQFTEAIEMAEAAFLAEMQTLVEHLGERLSGRVDGKPKIFRDSAVSNITSFLERFQQLNIGSSAQLDDLVAQCQDVVQGVEPQQLRDNTNLRSQVATDLGKLRDDLDSVMVDRPRRNILRRPR